MFEWIFNLFKKQESQIQPSLKEDDKLRIRKPKIYMCKGQRCKNAVNYTFYDAYDHSFKCSDCKSPLGLI